MRRANSLRALIALLALMALLVGFLPADRWAQMQGPTASAAANANTFRRESPQSRLTEPVPPALLAASMQHGVDFLVKNQNKDGSWGGPAVRPPMVWGLGAGGILDVAQAYTPPVTALCLEALIASGNESTKVCSAIEKGEAWLLTHLEQHRDTFPTRNHVWRNIYCVQALAAMYSRLPDDAPRKQRIEVLIRQEITALIRCQENTKSVSYGSFGNEHTSSFVDSAGLVALHRAKNIGVAPPEMLVKRTLQETARQRKPDSSYMYSKQPPNLGPYATLLLDEYKHYVGDEAERIKYLQQVTFIADLPGTLGRSQACNAALRLWGDEHITDEVLKTWLQTLILRNQWLDMARKMPGTHRVAFAGVAPYFYYFGHYYAGICTGLLPVAERAPFQDGLARIIMSHQEEDGSWFDWPLHNYHKPYGTAFALMTLQACRKQAIDK